MNLLKILYFDRTNLFAHFCFSKLLILREKKVRGFFFGAIVVPKKITNFQIILKRTPYRRVAQKRDIFAPGAANQTFFTHPVHLCHI